MAHGAPVGDMLGDARLLLGGHRLARAETGLMVVSVSRRCSRTISGHASGPCRAVSFAPPCDVVGLRSSHDGRRVDRRAGPAAGRRQRRGDARRRSRGGRHGARLANPDVAGGTGLGRPDEEQVRVDVGYATRRYRLPPDALDGDLACVHGPTPIGRAAAPSPGWKATSGC